ncbi:MAG: response regulator [Desulfobacterales bacterium]|nr:response regulator [Desulfobacterales bacterium]
MHTILVVEDNKDVSFVICETLRSYLGCRTIEAGHGKACLMLARSEAPDVILLDVRMPEMDGFEVCRILKKDEQTRRIPIIFLTATADDLKSEVRGLEIRADDYLVHPVDTLELVTRVRVMLRIKRLVDRMEKGESAFLSETAHKLRSPLNSIIGMAELIQKPFYGTLTEKQKEFAQTISKGGYRLLDMIDEIVG